jgi:hypothetical protein
VLRDVEAMPGCPALKLQSGAELRDPLGLARLFVAQDGSYQNYDLAQVSNDDSLSERDVRVANRIIARMGPDTVAAILSRAPAASAALARISPRASLVDQEGDIPWEALKISTERSRKFLESVCPA